MRRHFIWMAPRTSAKPFSRLSQSTGKSVRSLLGAYGTLNNRAAGKTVPYEWCEGQPRCG